MEGFFMEGVAINCWNMKNPTTVLILGEDSNLSPLQFYDPSFNASLCEIVKPSPI